jgi:hypothetical protein
MGEGKRFFIKRRMAITSYNHEFFQIIDIAEVVILVVVFTITAKEARFYVNSRQVTIS